MAAAKRKQISKKARFEVFKRDGFTCQYCGAHPPQVLLHVDHIIPVAAGGLNDQDNLITTCEPCNQGKGARSLDSVPATLAERATETAEREAQIAGYAEVMAAQRERILDQAWDVATIFTDAFRKDSFRRDWMESVKQFVEKLGVHECIRAMEIAVARKGFSQDTCFRYFCGICWTMIREGDRA